MTGFARFLIASSLTLLLSGYGYAADTATDTAKPAAAPTAPAASAPAQAAPVTAPAAKPQAEAASAATAGKECKIGYITMSRVATESAGGKAVAATLQAKQEKLKTKIEAKQKQLEKQKSAAEAKLPTMSPSERVAKGKELQKKFEEWQKLVRSSEKEMGELQDKLTASLYKTLKKVVTDYAKTNGYTTIIEEKAVLYMVDGITPKDVTDDVIALVDKEDKAK